MIIKNMISQSGQTCAHGTVATDLQMRQDSLMLFRQDAMPLGHVKNTNTPIYIFVGAIEGKTITHNYDYHKQLKSKRNKNQFIYTNPGKEHEV